MGTVACKFHPQEDGSLVVKRVKRSTGEVLDDVIYKNAVSDPMISDHKWQMQFELFEINELCEALDILRERST